jgi:TetR/AcrR family transcriptional repressor of mexJK operon
MICDSGTASKKRRAIIAAAEKCFLQQGFNGCSMDQIAADAGVAKQTLYSHFENKANLFQEVMCALCDESSPCPFEGRNLAEVPPEDFFREFAYAALNFMSKPKVMALYRIVMSEGFHNADLAERFMESGPRMMTELILDYLKLLEQRGKRVENSEMLAAAVYAFIKGPAYMDYIFGLATPSKKRNRQIADDATTLALKLLAGNVEG